MLSVHFLLFLLIVLSYIAKTSLYHHIAQSFSLKPRKRALLSLEQIKEDSNWHIQDVQHSIFLFISAVIKRPAQGLPMSEIMDELSQKKIDSSAIIDLQTLLDQCSFLAYSPDTSHQTSKIDICDKAIDIIKRMQL